MENDLYICPKCQSSNVKIYSKTNAYYQCLYVCLNCKYQSEQYQNFRINK